MRLACALLLAVAATGCADDAPPAIDAAVDATIDATDAASGPCGADFFLTGAYEDWDSTSATFDGIENAVWTVRGAPTRTFTTNPNGRVELCVAAGSASTIDIVAPDYTTALYVGDPAVFTAPGAFFFQVKGIRTVELGPFLTSLGVTLDPARGHALVQQQGTARALALTGGGTAFAVDDSEDLTWTAGATGGLVLFANVTPGTVTLSTTGAIVGPTALPIEAGKLTIVTIR